MARSKDFPCSWLLHVQPETSHGTSSLQVSLAVCVCWCHVGLGFHVYPSFLRLEFTTLCIVMVTIVLLKVSPNRSL